MADWRDDRAARPRGLRRAWRRAARLAAYPFRGFPAREIRASGRLIGELAAGQKPRGASGRFVFYEDGRLDCRASAVLHGLSVQAFERLLAERQAHSARSAYLCVALGVLFCGAWLWQAARLPWTGGHVMAVLEFIPFFVVFFAVAFRLALQNYAIRMRRRVSVGEFLRAPPAFWPH